MGNAMQCGLMVSFFQQFMVIQTATESSIVVMEEDLSTSKIQDTITLQAGNHAFTLFQELVDDTIKNAIIDIYGDFSEFTSPIISPSGFPMVISISCLWYVVPFPKR